ncbi:MAG TPA: hypothetical protein VK841_10300 [Polyangiaceae bacterium]|jgi:hypothetical protein|nr:hypothetical protein [Polyangiaceae bacterium]
MNPACEGADFFGNDNFPDRIYVAGSSAIAPVLSGIGGNLLSLVPVGAPPGVFSIIWQPADSCVALNDLIEGQPSGEVPVTDPPTVPPLPIYYGPSRGQTPPSGGILTLQNGTACTSSVPAPPVDIVVSDVYYETCENTTTISQMANPGHILGPIQAATFAAPVLSGASAISAEAAYVVFGYDALGYSVPPWTDPGSIFVRQSTSGIQTLLGAAIGLSAPLWANAELATAGAITCLPSEPMNDGCVPIQQQAEAPFMGDALANVLDDQSATIGVLSDGEVAQYNGGATDNKLKILAYQHAGQPCGYLPDSAATAKDKLNVRQGRYAAWGPLHFYYNVDGAGNPLPGNGDSSNTGKIAAMIAFLNYFIATGPNPGQLLTPEPLDTNTDALGFLDGGGPTALPRSIGAFEKQTVQASEISASLVPWCAMEVVRASEMGPEASYQPVEPCPCFYSVTTGATLPDYCVACTSDLDCSAPYPSCHAGYCEIQ